MTKLPPSAEGLSIKQLAGIQDELRDVKRVHTHGQEEDLRMALSRTITRVEELSSMLVEQYKAQTEIQTELTLCKSNLQLALANNEMLEDALKRDTSGRAKDVGWRRQPSGVEDNRSSSSLDVVRPLPDPITVLPPTPEATTSSDSRFFKFRFGGGSGRVTPQPSPTLQNGIHESHLSSASLPSLVPSREKELEELTLELERERKARKKIVDEKKMLEGELESLSQALFEEANKMVAMERMKLADAEAELHEVRNEKEALRNALRLVEDENGRYRQVLSSSSPILHSASPSSITRSHCRANTLPVSGLFPTSRSPSPLPQPKSALSSKSLNVSPSSSRSSSPEQSYATPSLVPIEYDSREVSPWAGVKSIGKTSTSALLPPPRASSLNSSHSLSPSPLDLPPWPVAIVTPNPSSLLPHRTASYPSQEDSLLSPLVTVPTIMKIPSVTTAESLGEASNDTLAPR